MADQTIFSIVPIEACKDRRLTLEQLRVLVTLLSFRGKNTDVVWPSRQQISERCGMHITNISEATSALVKLGWLEKEGKGGFSKATRYRINVPDESLFTVAHSATVAEWATVAHSATQTVADQATRMPVADSATRKELTSEQTSEQTSTGASAPAPKKEKRKLSPEMVAACKKTWEAYCQSYEKRYRIEPVGNAKVYSQIAAFVKRVGMKEAPGISGWFPSHTGAYYVSRGHTVDCLLSDAEKLRTEWATGSLSSGVKSNQWILSNTGITEKGAERGIVQGEGELFPYFKDRVYAAFGITEEMVRKARADQNG